MLEICLNLPPTCVWGLFARGLGLVFLIAFASLTHQVVAIAGARGVTPVAELMGAMERDFSRVRRYLYFPSLLWFSRSDGLLRALPWCGVGAAVLVICGGSWSPWALAACYAILLSLDRAVGLVYPWESLLLEAGFWALWLPPLAWLPDLRAVAPPLPALAWLYRGLLFRVLFGFGKQKFVGSTRSDRGFLHGFFIRQPLPTWFGWFAHRLPMPVHKLALALMFVIEVPLPFALFSLGAWSAVAGLAIALLMIAIGLTGNFGIFNVLTLVLTACAFDVHTPAEFAASWRNASCVQSCVCFAIGLHSLGALCSLPFNTWCGFTWTLWPLWLRVRPRFLTWPITWLRALQPLRWLHAYGVFPPRAAPAARIAPVVEVSWDGQSWQALRHRYAPTDEQTPPRFCAPHQARLDQAIAYEALGMNETGVLRNLTGRWDPYGHAHVSSAQRLLQCILEGRADSQLFFDGSLQTDREPPRFVRARSYMLEATSLAEWRSSGRYWRRTLIGPHLPSLQLSAAAAWPRQLPPPELWHFEDVVWLRRSRLGALIARARRGEDPHRLVLMAVDGSTGAERFDARDLERLWHEFLPQLPQALLHDWSELRGAVLALRERYSADQLHRFERLIARYRVCLSARCAPLFESGGVGAIFGFAPPRLPVATHYELGLLMQHIIVQGRACYDRVFEDPASASSELELFGYHSGVLFQALFRYENLVFHSQKYRLLENQLAQAQRQAVSPFRQAWIAWGQRAVQRTWGAFAMIDFLRGQLTGHADMLDVPERWPRFRLERDGRIVVSDRPE